MLKILKIILLVFITIPVFAGCNSNDRTEEINTYTNTKNVSVMDDIELEYKNLVNNFSANNPSALRKNFQNIDRIVQNETNSEETRKTARAIYCYTLGLYKLEVSGKGISELQYPDIIILKQRVPVVLNGKSIENLDETLRIAESFLKAVESEVN